MCKKTIQIDGLDSCLGEESADARFGTYLTHSKQDTRYNARLRLWVGYFTYVLLMSFFDLIKGQSNEINRLR